MCTRRRDLFIEFRKNNWEVSLFSLEVRTPMGNIKKKRGYSLSGKFDKKENIRRTFEKKNENSRVNSKGNFRTISDYSDYS